MSRIICVALGVTGWTTTAWGQSDAVAFIGVHVIPMTADNVILRDRTVIVLGDRIAEIGPVASVTPPAGATRIVATGAYLLPGLTDMHVHLEWFDDPAVLGLFVAAGVTTVRNMDGRPYILDWREGTRTGEILGPTIHTAGPILDGDPPIRDDNTIVSDADAARAAVFAQAEAGYDFIKVYTNLSPDAYRAVLVAATERELFVAGHVPRGVPIAEALRSGQRSIEHLAEYGDLVEADDSPVRDRFHWSKLYLAMPVSTPKMTAAARLIAASGVWTVSTVVQANRALATEARVTEWLAAPEMRSLPPEAVAFWTSQAESGRARMDADDWGIVRRGAANRTALLGALRHAGARVVVGTDTPNPFVIPGYAVHDELVNFVAAGFSPYQALAAATRDAAEFLQADRFGTVAAGARADLLLVDGNPLDDLRHLRRPRGVMTRGRWHSAETLDRRVR